MLHTDRYIFVSRVREISLYKWIPNIIQYTYMISINDMNFSLTEYRNMLCQGYRII